MTLKKTFKHILNAYKHHKISTIMNNFISLNKKKIKLHILRHIATQIHQIKIYR